MPKLSVEVPQWACDAFNSAVYAKNSVLHLLNPPRCEECEVRLPVSRYKLNHGKLLMENIGTKVLCPTCTAHHILDDEKSNRFINDNEMSDKCDCCGKSKPAYRNITTDNIRILFCIDWWNGFYVCEDCALDALMYGNIETSIFRIERESRGNYCIGDRGLYIKNGKCQLFRWLRW